MYQPIEYAPHIQPRSQHPDRQFSSADQQGGVEVYTKDLPWNIDDVQYNDNLEDVAREYSAAISKPRSVDMNKADYVNHALGMDINRVVGYEEPNLVPSDRLSYSLSSIMNDYLHANERITIGQRAPFNVATIAKCNTRLSKFDPGLHNIESHAVITPSFLT